QSAQGNVPVRGTRHAGTTRALAEANGAGAGAVCNPVHAVTRTQGTGVVRGAAGCDGRVQLSAVCVQGTSGFRRAEPSWLPARLRARELAEPRVTGALVYVPFRCHVCDALPSVRRTYGLGTRSTRRPPDTRRCPRSTTGQVAVGRAPAIRGSPPSSRQALPGSRWTSCSCGVIALTHQRRCGSCFSRGTPWHSRPCPGCGTRQRWRQGNHGPVETWLHTLEGGHMSTLRQGLLALGFATLVVGVPLYAQRKSNILTTEEIERANLSGATAYDLVHMLRPRWFSRHEL